MGCLLVLLGAAPAGAADPIRIGILPVLDTLPLQVAVRDGLFEKQGLQVALVPFNSAMERDVAMQSGRLDGYFGDLINTLLLIKSRVPMRIIATSYRSMPGQRMFALVTAPQVKASDPAAISKMKVGISNATIIEYLLDRMEQQGKIPADALIRTEVKKIPIRMQMLLAGQLDSAVLPEPLVTLAEKRGASVLVTDEPLDMPLTVLCLHEQVLKDRPQALAAFLTAYRQAIASIARDPERYRKLMAETCRIPQPLMGAYPIPRYPDPQLPERQAVDMAQRWMIQHKMLERTFTYDDLTAAP